MSLQSKTINWKYYFHASAVVSATRSFVELIYFSYLTGVARACQTFPKLNAEHVHYEPQ